MVKAQWLNQCWLMRVRGDGVVKDEGNMNKMGYNEYDCYNEYARYNE